MGLLGTTTQHTYYTGSAFGNYQFISLNDIITNFQISYVGDDKLIDRVNRSDIAFHAQRAIQELSFDTFKSCKSQEIEVCPSLCMPLPHDYVNYVKLTWVDGAGIEHIIYPTRHTSNPFAIDQVTASEADPNAKPPTTECEYEYNVATKTTTTTTQTGDNPPVTTTTTSTYNDTLKEQTSPSGETCGSSDTWSKYKGVTPAENESRYDDGTWQSIDGQRYGIEPEFAQTNGSFFIDCRLGKIFFSSNISGKTIILKYISDGLGTDAEMQVHKFAEEAMYKWIAYGIISAKAGVAEHIVQRFKREKFASTRTAKLRLSNIKIEELTQILRGKSKHIKS